MWPEWVPWLAQSGIMGILAWVGVVLHRSAIAAHSKRADAWKEIADERAAQIEILLGARSRPRSGRVP